MVLMVPSGRISLTSLLTKSATKTSPSASTAVVHRSRSPEPRDVATVGGNVGSVEYWKETRSLEPSVLTDAPTTAPVADTSSSAGLGSVANAATAGRDW